MYKYKFKMDKDKFKMDLQLFADEAGAEENVDNEEVVETFTKEEVDAMLQAEADKRVSAALKTAEAKWEEKTQAKIKAELEKTKRLTDLTAEDKEKELLKIKEEEVANREAALNRKILELDTVEALAAEELPVEFKDFVIGKDVEDTRTRITTFKEKWLEALKVELGKQVSTPPIKKGTTAEVNLGKALAKETSATKLEHNFFK